MLAVIVHRNHKGAYIIIMLRQMCICLVFIVRTFTSNLGPDTFEIKPKSTFYWLRPPDNNRIAIIVSNCIVYILAKIRWNVLAAWVSDFVSLYFCLYNRTKP